MNPTLLATQAEDSGTKMSVGDAAIVALVGYGVVFLGIVMLMVILYILLALAAIGLGITYYCFRFCFYVKEKAIISPDEFPIPEGEIYEAHRPQMVAWMKEVRALPARECWITSHDGLKLYGKYYECAPGATWN